MTSHDECHRFSVSDSGPITSASTDVEGAATRLGGMLICSSYFRYSDRRSDFGRSTMTELSGSVGVRNGVTPVANHPIDQGKVIGLLWSIAPANGGPKGVAPAPAAGPPNQCGPKLAAAIAAFQ